MSTGRHTTPFSTEAGRTEGDEATAPTRRLIVAPDPGGPDGGLLLMDPGPDGTEESEFAGEKTEGLPASRATVLSAAVAADLQDRWSRIQDRFPDDPRGCVQDADGLIEEISTALAAGIGEHRSRLAAAWQDGRPDVEELEKSLQEYRAFIGMLIPGARGCGE